MDTNYLAAHILCTAEEKQACMDTVDKLMTMARTARCCGLVELEQLVRHERYSRPALIRVGVSLIADGADPDTVQQILENYILAAGMSNQEFLENIVVSRGISAIQHGACLSHFRELLCSFFGMDFREQFLSRFAQEQETLGLDELLELHREKLASFPKASALDFILEEMENFGIQCVIRETDFSELECALAGSNPDVIRIFLKNMGEGRRLSFFEFVACIKKLELSAVENCQQEIKSVISRLARQGEICLGKPAAITQRKEQDADK